MKLSMKKQQAIAAIESLEVFLMENNILTTAKQADEIEDVAFGIVAQIENQPENQIKKNIGEMFFELSRIMNK